MNNLIKKSKSILVKRPPNAFLLTLTGFFFAQVMLVNILYTNNPFGGWETTLGTFTTRSILMTSIVVLSFCLIALWRSASKVVSCEIQLDMNKNMLAPA